MNIKSVISLGLFCAVLFCGSYPQAQAATLTESLARMDAIIAEMQKLRSEFALVTAATPLTPASAVLGASVSSVLSDDLTAGVTNVSIEKIQRLLATDAEIYADGTVSGFFGPKTQDAIRRFQSRFGLDTVGVVGPSTKAILEAFMRAYPDEKYPTGILKGTVPQVAGASISTPSVMPVVLAPSVQNAVSIAAITFEDEDGEVIVHSRNKDGSRNRDLIFYPKNEDALVQKIASALKISETAVRSIADLDEVRFGGGNDDEESDAEDAIDDAKDAIETAKDVVDEANADGENVNDAEDLLDEAEDLLDEAEEAFDDEDFEDAIDAAEEAIELAEDAEDEL